jgi:ubiquinone/menaquinone biosynthesis C-methylase UbiE
VKSLDDPEEVEAQYHSSANFDARVRIYERYANSPVPWLAHVYQFLALRGGERVLDVGCGPGNIWRDNAANLPGGVELTLADLSQGMLDEAAERLCGCGLDARFEVADVQSLPYSADSFDLVVANHMLYHVTDRAAALRELHRVVRSGGRCIISTNDWPHLIELRELIDRFEIPNAMRRVGRENGFFDAEQAGNELCALFDAVTSKRFHDSLDVADADTLVAYVRSMSPTGSRSEAALGRLHSHASGQIARLGSLHITTSVVTFDARKN